jgi:hypothetical protein
MLNYGSICQERQKSLCLKMRELNSIESILLRSVVVTSYASLLPMNAIYSSPLHLCYVRECMFLKSVACQPHGAAHNRHANVWQDSLLHRAKYSEISGYCNFPSSHRLCRQSCCSRYNRPIAQRDRLQHCALIHSLTENALHALFKTMFNR